MHHFFQLAIDHFLSKAIFLSKRILLLYQKDLVLLFFKHVARVSDLLLIICLILANQFFAVTILSHLATKVILLAEIDATRLSH